MNSNLMSLGGIAIAIGAMVDAAIVMIENAHKHLERLPPEHDRAARAEAMIAACREVGPALFFSLLIITVSFLPVFTLEAQEGRMFSPLAWTKTFAMGGAAMHTEHNLFSAHPVTALLAPPPLYRGERQTIIEIRCRPVYCVFSSVGQCFRIGLQFIKFAGNDRHVLEERLQHHIPAFENKT